MACGMKDYTSHRGIGCHKCNHFVSSINAIHQGLEYTVVENERVILSSFLQG